MVLCALLLIWAVGLFALAGTFSWSAAWEYLGVVGGALGIHRIHVAKRNPELVIRRRAIGVGTKWWDVIWGIVFWPLMLAVPFSAALDLFRFQGKTMPFWLWPLGAAFAVGGILLSAWAMGINPHFEGTVRIQSDRGHMVIQTGPYQIIRHPGYLGLVLWAFGTPLMLGSQWAFVAAGVVIAWILIRTFLEDRMLHRELERYCEYAGRVRFRMFPGIW